MLAVVHADQQRAQLPGLARPAADHDFVAGAALRLGPVADAARTVRRIEALRDDAFEVHAARRFQHLGARALRNDRRSGSRLFAPTRCDAAASSAAPCARAAAAGADPGRRGSSRSNANNTRSSTSPSDNAACSAPKSGAPFVSSAATSPSMMQSGSFAAAAASGWNLSVQSRPLRVLSVASARRRAAACDSRRACFVRPVVALRRTLDELGQLGLDEIRHLARRCRLSLEFQTASARASLRVRA